MIITNLIYTNKILKLFGLKGLFIFFQIEILIKSHLILKERDKSSLFINFLIIYVFNITNNKIRIIQFLYNPNRMKR